MPKPVTVPENHQEQLPIREVSRLTGVNPVTLRAWERRYGLIKPLRTPKGHRLYDETQIQRIREILSWLRRGVAVSQVKPLLDRQHRATDPDESKDSWYPLRQQHLVAMEQLSEKQLDQCFNQATILYPPRLLSEQLLLPLLEQLEQRWCATTHHQLEKVFFFGWLRTRLGQRIHAASRYLEGSPLLLMNLSPQPLEPHLWVSAWLATSAGCPVQVLDWPVPANELALAMRQWQPRAVLLYSNERLDRSMITQHLPQLVNTSTCPILLIGQTCHIHATALLSLPPLQQAPGSLQALDWLAEQGLLPLQESPCTN